MPDYDLMQTGARLRRFLLALLAAGVVGAVTGVILWSVIDPSVSTKTGDWKQGPWKALFFFTAMAGGVAFLATSAWLKRRHDRSWTPPPVANVVDRQSDKSTRNRE